MRFPQHIYDDLAMMLLRHIEQKPGIWTAALCRLVNGIQETRDGIRYCGLCQDYANPRKRARAEKWRLPTLPGMDAPYQIHPACSTLRLKQIQGLLARLSQKCDMIHGFREQIPDQMQARGWDWGTRWYPNE